MNKKLDFILIVLIISLLSSCQNRNTDDRKEFKAMKKVIFAHLTAK